MADPLNLDQIIASGREIFGRMQAASEAWANNLQITAGDRNANGSSTPAAKNALQTLRNGALNTTRNALARSTTGKTYNDLIEDVRPRFLDLLPDIVALFAAGQQFAIYSAAAEAPAVASRKRSAGGEISHEWVAFIRRMEASGVPASAMDQFNQAEIDFLAQLAREKADDPRHRKPLGAWMTFVRAGGATIPVEALTDDEAEAFLRKTDRFKDHEEAARSWLNELAGRPLDIPGQLALAIVQNATADPDDVEFGFDKNRLTARSIMYQKDLRCIMRLLDLDPEDIRRAQDFLHPGSVRYEESLARQQLEDQLAEVRRNAEVDLYLRAAEGVIEKLEAEDRARDRRHCDPQHPLEAETKEDCDGPDARLATDWGDSGHQEWSGRTDRKSYVRNMATTLVIAPEWQSKYAAHGVEMPERAAVEEAVDQAVQAYLVRTAIKTEPSIKVDDLDAASIKSIAAQLYARDPKRRNLLWEGTGLPSCTFNSEKLIPALEAVLLREPGNPIAINFLSAAKEGRAVDLARDVKSKQIAQIESGLLLRNETILAEAMSVGLLT